jgi:hypothetical protein
MIEEETTTISSRAILPSYFRGEICLGEKGGCLISRRLNKGRGHYGGIIIYGDG